MIRDSVICVRYPYALDAALDAARARSDALGIDVAVQYDRIVIAFRRSSEGCDIRVIAETPQNRVQYDPDVALVVS